MSEEIFSKDEWQTTIKVLQALSKDPFLAPNEYQKRFKSLITKIRKKAQKSFKDEKSKRHSKAVETLSKKTVIVDKALSIESNYSPEKINTNEIVGITPKTIRCYCCKKDYNEIHFYYHKLCPSCAQLNYKNRFTKTDLTGRYACITGARIKVGYATCLALLRAGATVIATTRFPATALEQYKKEDDYENWKDRLILYGLDLRFVQTVEEFISYLKNTIPHLDILINNAAQTIKYPSSYYSPFIQIEQEYSKLPSQKNLHLLDYVQTGLVETNSPLAKITPALNRFSQPVDFREHNSWIETLEQIDTVEMIEANLINSISPAMLNSQLKSLMQKSPFNYRFIINVTSTEGQFSYQGKTKFHPHTNMTKAALNMMTRTSAQDYIDDKILMNSVDVGWVSTGNPEVKRKRMEENGFVPPLDSVDSAARIMHPIIASIENGEHNYGKLFKDYTVVSW